MIVVAVVVVVAAVEVTVAVSVAVAAATAVVVVVVVMVWVVVVVVVVALVVKLTGKVCMARTLRMQCGSCIATVNRLHSAKCWIGYRLILCPCEPAASLLKYLQESGKGLSLLFPEARGPPTGSAVSL